LASSTSNGSLFFSRSDSISGNPLVFVNGLGGQLESWFYQTRYFSKTREVLCFDHRGNGRSPFVDGAPRIETYVADLVELLDSQGIAQADFVGISFGGRVLQALALQAPHRVRRLVLVATSAAPLSSKRSNILSKIGTMSAEQIFNDIVPLLFSPAYISANEKRLRAFAAGRARKPLDPRGIAMQWEALSHFDVRTELDTLDHPVLVVHGTADALCPIQAAHNLVQGLPNAELFPMDGVGHSPQVEDWEAFNQALDNFLSLPQA
jgi:pimeloyl-ACP methyl ester carboxylesterase